MKMRWKVLIGVTVVFLIICTLGYIDQDIKYPSVKYQIYAMHETFELSGFEFEVEDVQTYDLKQYAEDHSLSIAALNYEDDMNLQMILVTVSAKNVSNEDKTINFTNLVLSSKDYSNGLELITFMELHNGSSEELAPLLKPGESSTVELPFTEYGYMWGVEEGSLVSEIPLQLTFKLYPKKYSVHLNDLW